MLEPLGGQPLGYQKPKSRKKLILIIALAVILPIIFIVGIGGVVLGALFLGTKQTDEYKCAISELKKNKDAVKVLGEPMEPGFLAFGELSISNHERSVHFQTSITGSKSKGKLSVSSFRNQLGSNFQMFLNNDGQEITLYNDVYPCR